MGRKFTAQEMKEAGMVARIFPKETFMEEVIKAATVAAKYPPQAMKDTKRLIREHELKFLEDVNTKEMILLGQRMASEESANAIVEFMSKFMNFGVVFKGGCCQWNIIGQLTTLYCLHDSQCDE